MSFLPTTKDWAAARPKDLVAGLTVGLLAGVRDEHRRRLETHGVPMFATTPEVIDHARHQLRQSGVL